MPPYDYKSTPKEQMLKDLYAGSPGAPIHEEIKMAIVMRCAEDLQRALASLEASMNENAKSSESLATKVYWLNWVLAGATVLGTLLAVYQIFFSTNP